MNKQGRIFVVGDIHGNPKIVSTKKFPEGKELTKQDVVIFLGDFGLYWSNPPSGNEVYWREWLNNKPFTVAFLDGNHENFNMINSFEEIPKWGGTVGKDPHFDIFHLKRGHVYNINQKSIFTLGGALSIDKAYRTENKSWWAEEQHSKEEETRALDNLDKVNWEVDHVLTHTCPDDIVQWFLDSPNSSKFNDPVSRFLSFIDNRLSFKLWSFGHMHNDRVYERSPDEIYQCHYKIIRELEN